MLNMAKRLFVEEDGQGMTEYALVLGVIALGAIMAMIAVKGQVGTLWNNIKDNLDKAL